MKKKVYHSTGYIIARAIIFLLWLMAIAGIIGTLLSLIFNPENDTSWQDILFSSSFALVISFLTACVFLIEKRGLLKIVQVFFKILFLLSVSYFFTGLILETVFDRLIEDWVSCSTGYLLPAYLFYTTIKKRIYYLDNPKTKEELYPDNDKILL